MKGAAGLFEPHAGVADRLPGRVEHPHGDVALANLLDARECGLTPGRTRCATFVGEAGARQVVERHLRSVEQALDAADFERLRFESETE